MQGMMLEIKEKFNQKLDGGAYFRRVSTSVPDIATSVSPSMSLLPSTT